MEPSIIRYRVYGAQHNKIGFMEPVYILCLWRYIINVLSRWCALGFMDFNVMYWSMRCPGTMSCGWWWLGGDLQGFSCLSIKYWLMRCPGTRGSRWRCPGDAPQDFLHLIDKYWHMQCPHVRGCRGWCPGDAFPCFLCLSVKRWQMQCPPDWKKSRVL